MCHRKHIALLKSRSSQCGGLEKYANRIASAFVEKGARVSILTTGMPSSLPKTSSLSFHHYKTSPWPASLRMEQFDSFVRSWLSEHPADLVFGMDRNRQQTHLRAGNGVHAAYLQSRLFTEGHLKHWVCTLNPMHRKILALEKQAFESPCLRKLFTNSHMVRQQVLEHYATDPAKIEVIHNGVEWNEMETDFLAWEEKRFEVCAQFHLDPHQFHFLFIGNGYLRKGLGKLLEALSRLSDSDFHLSVVGKDNKMELFQEKATQLGLQQKVRFFGSQRDARPFYQLADALVIPSFYDPFANVTIEALAMGLHVVSSKHNGGHEILHPDHGTLIENLLDPDSLLFALEQALRHRKTREGALQARLSVASLDFSQQLDKLMAACE